MPLQPRAANGSAVAAPRGSARPALDHAAQLKADLAAAASNWRAEFNLPDPQHSDAELPEGRAFADRTFHRLAR